MSRKIKLVLVSFALAITAIPAFAIFAASKPVISKVAAQTTPTCTDADFIKAVDKDLNDLAPAFKNVTNSAADAANVIISVAITRQKYEDLTAPQGCLGVQIQTIVTLSNFGDLAAVVLASQVDTKTDPQVYKDALTRQNTRFQTQLTGLNKLIFGDAAATPAATEAQ